MPEPDHTLSNAASDLSTQVSPADLSGGGADPPAPSPVVAPQQTPADRAPEIEKVERGQKRQGWVAKEPVVEPAADGDDPEPDDTGIYDKAYVDRLKQQLKGREDQAKTEAAARADAENRLRQAEEDRLLREFQMRSGVKPDVPPTPQSPTLGPVSATSESIPETFLNEQEQDELQTAFDSLDSKTITKLQNLDRHRYNQHVEQVRANKEASQATTQAAVNRVTAELGQANEFKDPAVAKSLLAATIKIMSDSSAMQEYGHGELTLGNFGTINPFVLKGVLLQYRAYVNAQTGGVAASLTPEAHGALAGQSGPKSASPSASPSGFEMNAHLSQSELSMLSKAIQAKSGPYSQYKSLPEAAKAFWGKMKAEEKGRRLKARAPARGSGVQKSSGKAGDTIWKSKRA